MTKNRAQRRADAKKNNIPFVSQGRRPKGLIVSPGDVIHGMFQHATITTQAMGTEDEHLLATLRFAVLINNQNEGGLCVVKQSMGIAYHEEDHLELVSVDSPAAKVLDREELRAAAEAYMNTIVGPDAHGIRIGRGSSLIVENSEFSMQYEFFYTAKNPYAR